MHIRYRLYLLSLRVNFRVGITALFAIIAKLRVIPALYNVHVLRLIDFIFYASIQFAVNRQSFV